jgi:pimeloyl-ACP methyl ester carboxylesterase
MLIAQMPVAVISAIVAVPILVVSACISKLYSCISKNKPIDVSRETFIDEIADYVSTSKVLTSTWTCNGMVHVLCRHATVFSGYPPIVIIHGTKSCSLDYAEFMQSLPRVYDVYCIDLPGWGISEDPYFNLADNSLRQCCEYYGAIIMTALSEIYPAKNAKFMFVGHSFGAFLLVKTIANGYIPRSKIESCTLACPSGLDTTTNQIMGALFSFGFQESIFKQWWSQHLFSAFLYRKKTQLQTLQNMCQYIQNGNGYKLVKKQFVFRYLWWFRVEWVNLIQTQLLYISSSISVKLVCGLHDQLIDCVRTKNVSNESSSKIKFHALKGGHSLFSQKELFSRLLAIIDDEVK